MKKITTATAAKLMGKSAVFVREAMKREVIDIGVALQMGDCEKWSFFVSPAKLAAYLGITVEQLWAKAEEVI